jgi:hypothetical protein
LHILINGTDLVFSNFWDSHLLCLSILCFNNDLLLFNSSSLQIVQFFCLSYSSSLYLTNFSLLSLISTSNSNSFVKNSTIFNCINYLLVSGVLFKANWNNDDNYAVHSSLHILVYSGECFCCGFAYNLAKLIKCCLIYYC